MPDLDRLVRTRLRSLRQSFGWSLDQLADRSHLSASTISRIETGKRTVSLDVLLPLARALQIDVDSLLADDSGDRDVVIRPDPAAHDGMTSWTLGQTTGGTTAVKLRLEPRQHRAPPLELRVHPGDEWFYVLSGTVHLNLGERTIVVTTGEAAEFSTMTPHAIEAVDAPAELLILFDRDGERAHLDHSGDGGSTS